MLDVLAEVIVRKRGWKIYVDTVRLLGNRVPDCLNRYNT